MVGNVNPYATGKIEKAAQQASWRWKHGEGTAEGKEFGSRKSTRQTGGKAFG